jgi:hypothetical protein
MRIHALLLALTAAALPACGGPASTTTTGTGGAGGETVTTTTTTTTSATNTIDLQPGECRDPADCINSATYCAVPGGPSCGGDGCGLEPCFLDGDCLGMSDPFVCEIDACCGDKRCVPSCSIDIACPEGQACTADFHCVPQPCGTLACPPNFDCGDGAVPSCARRGCSLDVDCDGFCVLGDCYPAPGTCEPPKP